MNIAIRYDKGLGNAAVYARLLGPLGFWDFTALSWSVAEVSDCRAFMAEASDSSDDLSWYQAQIAVPEGGPYPVEYVALSTGDVIGNDITWGGSEEPEEVEATGGTAQIISFLLSQVSHSGGTVLTAGKVFFYAAGTSIFKTVWLDRNKSAIAANPYTLTDGTAQIYADGVYRIVIKDASGAVRYDRDGLEFGKPKKGDVQRLSDYASLPAAISAIGANPATLYYDADVTLSGNLTIPANIELFPLNGAIIHHGAYTLTYYGSTARFPMVQVFDGTAPVAGLRNAATSWFAGDVQKAVAAASVSVAIDTAMALSSTVTVNKPLTLTFSAVIVAAEGFTGDSVFKATCGGVVFEHPVIDAAKVPRLNAAYNGSQEPQGTAIYFLGTSGAHLQGGTVKGGTLTDAPFVGVFVKYADDVTVDSVNIDNAGHQTADLSPGAIYYVYSLRPVATRNKILTPGLKGIVAGTGSDDALFEGNYVADGQTPGFAAYMVSNSKGWRCIGNKSKSIFGIKFDGGAAQNADFTILGNSIEDADNGGIIIQGGYSGVVAQNTIAGWSKSAAASAIEIFGDPANPAYIGPLFITGNTIRYNGTAAANVNGVSIYSATTYGPASDIAVANNYIEGAYIGVYSESGTGGDHTRVKVAGNTIKNCTYDGVNLKGQGVDVLANTIISAGNNGVFVTGDAGDTAANGISIKDNDIITPTAYGVYVHSGAVATSLDISGNRINAASLGVVFYQADIPSISIARNNVFGTTGLNSITFEAKAGTTHTASITDNFSTKRIQWTLGTGGFIGSCRWNVQGTPMVSAPSGVVVETSGAGTPETVVSAPMGSVYHRTDGDAGTSLYIKTSGTGNTGWTAK
jgi:hypothetical protein